MKYFLIAGEASGDIHAAQVIKSIKEQDANAQFCFLGGDLMANVAGSSPIIHYRDMAFMGFIEVIKHLPQILKIMKLTKQSILDFKPDAVILIDYPSFNLKIAKYAFALKIPVFYYISPKVWAWKEYRVKSIKKYITRLYSILPFETEFFAKHNYDVEYVGNPSVKEIDDIISKAPDFETFTKAYNLDTKKPIIAILPGSRRKEITNNLPEMLKATHKFPNFQVVIAGAPGINTDYYKKVIKTEGSYDVPTVIFNDTFSILKNSTAALVTSGTATLETAIIGIPQIVCYRLDASRLTYSIYSRILKVKYVSLPNLISDNLIVPELLLHHCSKENIATNLEPLLTHSPKRDAMIEAYANMRSILGTKDGATTVAKDIINRIKTLYYMNLPNIDKKPIKILFVCLGNICRSPAAQGVMEHLLKNKGLQNSFIIDSAGTYGGHAGELPDQRMRVHAQRRGYNLTHRSRPVTNSDFNDFDIIIGMDNQNISALKAKANTIDEEQKIIPIASLFRQHPHNDHVPDPYYEGSQGFELVLDLIEDACLNLMEKLEK